MEQELQNLISEMELFLIPHPIEVIRIKLIRKMVSIACQSSFASKLETELRTAEAAYDRERHAREVTKVSRW